MVNTEELFERYRRYLTAGQKKRLRKKAEALSLANASARMKLVRDDAARIRKANALLTDYGLATDLYHAPVSGIDALKRRPELTETGAGARDATETAALGRAVKRAANETRKKREREKKKGPGGKAPAPAPEDGIPERSVTVRKL